MDIFCDKCFKNNPVSQNSSPSLVMLCVNLLENAVCGAVCLLIRNAVCSAVCELLRNVVCGTVCEPIMNFVCNAVCEPIGKLCVWCCV